MGGYNLISGDKLWFFQDVENWWKKFQDDKNRTMFGLPASPKMRRYDTIACRRAHSLKLKAGYEESNAKPCPKCGAGEPKYKTIVSYGHGDCGHEAWVECGVCGIRAKSVHGWGHPGIESKLKSYKNWNL